MNDIDYLRKILEDYENYNITRYINVSLLAELENLKEFPCIVIWEDLDSRINVSSKEEYEMIINSFKSKNKVNNINIKILSEIDDKDKIEEILDTLLSYRNYDDKLTSLIYILSDNKKLSIR